MVIKKTTHFIIDPDSPQEELIAEAAEMVRAGGLVAFPTETVYGLAALPEDEIAVEKLRFIKKREQDKKFSLCVSCIEQVEERIKNISPFAYRLMAAYWPGPLTLVLSDEYGQTTGFRMPDHSVALMFLRSIGSPVLAPSANFSGDAPPTDAKKVLEYFDGKIDAVIDAGQSRIGESSTVLEITEQGYSILREGSVTRNMVEEIYKKKNILFVCTGNSCRSAMAEGMMKAMVRGNEYIHVESAGIAAFGGMPASAEAVEAMKRRGIDISRHQARRITNDMVKNADYILVMDTSHRNFMHDRYWKAKGRTFLLKEFLKNKSKDLSIHDPIGQDAGIYEKAADMIEESIQGLKESLL